MHERSLDPRRHGLGLVVEEALERRQTIRQCIDQRWHEGRLTGSGAAAPDLRAAHFTRCLAKQVIPWQDVLAIVEPHYPKDTRGLPPVGLERLLRMLFIQQWYHLSDEGAENEVTESQSVRGFVGVDLSREAVPDATTLLQGRHRLDEKELTKPVFGTINAHLSAEGLMMREGTIADAMILAASPSVKNEAKARDPEMHQTKKGNQWTFGMEAHIGVDADSGLMHTVVGTAANMANVTQAGEVLHSEEKTVHLDAGTTGVEKRAELKDRKVDRVVAAKPGKLKAIPQETKLARLLRRLESVKASIRAKVEHPFHTVKNLFGHRKVRYPDLEKNTAQRHLLFALANLVIAKPQLLAVHSQRES